MKPQAIIPMSHAVHTEDADCDGGGDDDDDDDDDWGKAKGDGDLTAPRTPCRCHILAIGRCEASSCVLCPATIVVQGKDELALLR
jgi:hypothetical protein